MVEGTRSQSVDIEKGILIILVVVAHAQRDIVHDIIFMFHMPLFFVISGFLIKREKLLKAGYMMGKIKHLIILYVVYLVIDMLLVRKTFSVHDWMYAIWGGRAVTGVYWYITCFLFTLFLFFALIRKFPDAAVKGFALIGGGIAVIESHLIDNIHFLQSPGIPWNLDVSLMALIYLTIGFYYKGKIKELLKSDLKKYDLAAGILAAVLALICWFIYRDGNRLYYFDMKPVCYKELISALLIPCAFGFVFVRLVYWMEKNNWLKV
ncbi:acyltransferase family protein [Sharpea porci]|uniref:acyltransferase family protein n=1 Tax=Sharpea porci TaxID=2652286 RepID=UPI001E2D96B7|nr:acyltransferase family protein [Sharpea porci]